MAHWGLIDMESEARLLSVCLLVPLADRTTVKKEVIILVDTSLGGGWRIWERSPSVTLMYKARHL